MIEMVHIVQFVGEIADYFLFAEKDKIYKLEEMDLCQSNIDFNIIAKEAFVIEGLHLSGTKHLISHTINFSDRSSFHKSLHEIFDDSTIIQLCHSKFNSNETQIILGIIKILAEDNIYDRLQINTLNKIIIRASSGAGIIIINSIKQTIIKTMYIDIGTIGRQIGLNT